MKKIFLPLAGFMLAALPALAAPKFPPVNPFLLAQAQQQYLEQDVTLLSLTSVTVDAGAHTAHISGIGTASFDSGATQMGGAPAQIDITIANTADPQYQSCQDALAPGLPPNSYAQISGQGYYHVNMQNNNVTSASVTIQKLTGCMVSK